jgi:hypothetical protein
MVTIFYDFFNIYYRHLFLKIIPVILDEFPEWLQRSSIDRRIKDTSTKLGSPTRKKRIARIACQCQGNQKEKKKNNSGE